MLSPIEPKTFKSMLGKFSDEVDLNRKPLIVQLKEYPSCIPKRFTIKEEHKKKVY